MSTVYQNIKLKDFDFHPNFEFSENHIESGKNIEQISFDAMAKALFNEYAIYIEIDRGYSSHLMQEERFRQMFKDFVEPLLHEIDCLKWQVEMYEGSY